MNVSEIAQMAIDNEFREHINDYGLLLKCKTCLRIENGCRGQYAAPGLTMFYCKDYHSGKGLL